MRFKDVIRLEVQLEPGGPPAAAEIRAQPEGAGWAARLVLMRQGGEPQVLGRVFRSRDRRVAVGKMWVWTRRRYPGARAVPSSAGARRALLDKPAVRPASTLS